MRRVVLGVLALVLGGSAVAGAQTDEERDELRRRLRDLQREMAEIQRQLGEYQGILRVAEPLVLAGFGNRGRLGVIVDSDRNSATDSIGALLTAVTPDGPAAVAGLQAWDIIVSMNGEALAATRRWQTPGDKLIELAGDLEIGDSVAIEYQRDGRRRSVTVVAGRVPGYAYSFVTPHIEIPRIAVDTLRLREYAEGWGDRARELAERVRVQRIQPGGPLVISMFTRWADMELATLDEALGTYFGTTEGLLVVRAPRDDLLGLRSGDVILRIGGRVPSNPSHAIRILRSYEPGDEIRMDIMRNKRRETITAIVPERDRGLFWDDR